MDETSLSLIARIRQSSDHESWDRMVDMYSPLLRRWLGKYDVQDADADDIVQDVLVAIARELPAFEHNRRVGAFRTWLRRILVNRLRNHWRARQHRPLATGDSSLLERLNQLEDNSSSITRVWDTEHDRAVVVHLLDLIRPNFLPKTWEAFHRQMFGGKRAVDVASELNMPLSSVYVARSRVLSALRREAAGLIDSL